MADFPFDTNCTYLSVLLHTENTNAVKVWCLSFTVGIVAHGSRTCTYELFVSKFISLQMKVLCSLFSSNRNIPTVPCQELCMQDEGLII